MKLPKDVEKKFDEGIGGMAENAFDYCHEEFCIASDNCDCHTKYDQLKQFLATALEEEREKVLSEVEEWVNQLPDWQWRVTRDGLVDKLNQLKEGKC